MMPRRSDGFWLPWTPMPAPRPRAGRGGVHNPQAYTDWKDNIAWDIKLRSRQSNGDFGDVPVEVNLMLYPTAAALQIVEADPNDGRDTTRRRLKGDIDNYLKAYLDALQHSGVIVNDRQVVAVRATLSSDPDLEGGIPWVR